MANARVGDAISAGLGLGLGLALTSYMFQTVKPPKETTKPLVVCLNCQGRNPQENKFCWQCGSALYPRPAIQCRKCRATVPSMKYCGNCGSSLKK